MAVLFAVTHEFFALTVGRTYSEEWPSSGESKNDDDERISQASKSPKDKECKDKEKDLESRSCLVIFCLFWVLVTYISCDLCDFLLSSVF